MAALAFIAGLGATVGLVKWRGWLVAGEPLLLVLHGGVLRVAAGLAWLDWRVGVYAASLCWSGAFAVFLWRYTPILLGPRIDGKQG